MSNDSWDHIPKADVQKLNALAEEMEYGSTTLGHQSRRRLALIALKAAYELGGSPQLASAEPVQSQTSIAVEK